MFGSSFLPQIFTYLWHCFQICWALLALTDFAYCAQHFWEARQIGRGVFESHTTGSDIHGRHVQCWCLGDSVSEAVPSMPLPDDEFSLYIEWVLASHIRLFSTSWVSYCFASYASWKSLLLSIVGTYVRSAVIFHAHRLLFIITAVFILMW